MGSIGQGQTKRTSEARIHSRSTARIIDAAKAAVPVIDLADRLCGPGGLRRVGGRWVGRCPLPDHEDRTPSFVVYPDNHWHCYGCVRGSDVVRLACLHLGYAPRSRDEQEAAAWVLHTFGHDIPGRPQSWHARNKRQAEARAALSRVRVGATQRRIYELLRREQDSLGNTDPTDAEREYMWEGARAIAALLVRDREDREARAKGGRGAA